MKTKSLIHINSYYLSNKLHAELVKTIERQDDSIKQIVFVPYLKGSITKSRVEEENLNELNNTTLVLSDNFNTLSRVIWPLKIWKIYRDYKKRFKDTTVDFTHAHSLISNGVISYLLNKKKGIPYIVTVRNTDINTFMKRSILFRKLGEKILLKSNAIVVLSPAYRDKQLRKHISLKVFKNIQKKIQVIPNGVNDFWIENNTYKHSNVVDKVNLLFVGKLRENKNILGLLEACSILYERGVQFALSIAGEGNLRETIINNDYKFDYSLLGHVNSKDELMKVYRKNHMLIVPSFKESFGLVYVEAMTQGLPVIYTKDQGFDGFFIEGEVGYSVLPTDYEGIANKIELLISNYTELSKNANRESQIFSWDNTCKSLVKLYNRIDNK